jgi:hypothetical protein
MLHGKVIFSADWPFYAVEKESLPVLLVPSIHHVNRL